jgi:hypothetical protein
MVNLKNIEVDGKNYWYRLMYCHNGGGYEIEVMPEREPIRKVSKVLGKKKEKWNILELASEMIKQIK